MRKIASLLSVLMLLCTLAFGQTRTVSGKVTDNQGNAIPFATITEAGTKNATQADANGNYTITVRGNGRLTVSAAGYQAQTLTASGATANITLATGQNQLQEVVVTALGIQRQAKELGYSTAKISNQTLTQAKVTDISTGLAGKVSGLQVNLTSNSVSPSTRIVLRGNRSLTGNNQALLVLDGVPIDDPSYVNKINPEDVDNVTVLKGAVAAAIYGSKASNGVLVITTKHGTRGKPVITVSNTTSLENISYMPKFQNTFGAYGGEGSYTNANGTVQYVPYENQSYGPAYDGSTVPLGLGVPVFDASGNVVRLDTQFVKYTADPNNKRNFFNTGLTNQFDVSFSAGDERSQFYIGFQDVNVNGIVPKDKSRRDNIRVGGAREYGRFRADYTLSYNQSKVDVVGLSYNQTNGGVFSGRPLYFEVINNPAHIPLTSFKNWQTDIHADPNGFFDAYATNPYWTIDNSRRKTNSYDLIGNLNLAFKIASWLTVSDRVGLTQTTQQAKYTRAGITFAPWAIADPWGAGNVPSSQGYLAPSSYDQTFMEQRINNDLIGAFNKDFGDFSLKGLVGYNFAQRYRRSSFLQSDNLQFPGFYNVSSVLGIPGYGEGTYRQREYSIYEEATLGFRNYLFLHVSNRDEWNSVLDPSQQHFEYPGADLSFVFTQAISSLNGNKVLSYGKVRGGLTRVSNINLGTNPYGAYSLINPFVPATGFPFGSIGGYTQSTTFLNPLIKPEVTDEFEIGFELGFLNNRFNLQGDYYKSISKNQNLSAQISPATGFTSKVVNAGQVTNKGVELDLNATPVRAKNITWNVGISYAHYNNRVDELLPGVDELQLSGLTNGLSGGIYAVKGQPYPVIKTTDWIRDSATGKVIVDPVTGEPSVDPNSKVFGNTNPTDILGITTSISFLKGFTFSAVADYRSGNYIMNEIGSNLDFTGVSYHSAENGRQRFIFPNSVVLQGGKYVENTSVAVANGGNIGGAGFWPTLYTSGIGSVYITSAAFWKLREASLTYEIPSSVISKSKVIKRAVIGLVGRNLIMLRPKSNFWTDPEFSQDNSNAVGRTSELQTPPTRIYGANITLTF